MLILFLLVLAGDLHDVILSLHHQLLRSKVVDVQGDLPAVGALPDLGDAAAQLPAQRPAVGRPRGRQQGALAGQQTEVSGPGAAAGPLVPILGDVRHPEGLVEEAAAMVPVAEGLPAGAGEEAAVARCPARPEPRRLGAAAAAAEPVPLAGPRGRRASSARSLLPVLSERRSPPAARSAPVPQPPREGGRCFPEVQRKVRGIPLLPPSGAFARSLRHDAQDAAVQAAAGGRGSVLLRGGCQVRGERRAEEKVPQRDPAAAAEEARPAAAVPGGAGRRGGDVPRPLPAPLLLLPRRRAGVAARRGQDTFCHEQHRMCEATGGNQMRTLLTSCPESFPLT